MKGHVSHGTVVIFACFCEIGRGTSRLEKPPPTNQTAQPCRNPGINDRFGNRGAYLRSAGWPRARGTSA